MKQFHQRALIVPPIEFWLHDGRRNFRIRNSDAERYDDHSHNSVAASAVLELSSQLALESCGACKLRAFERHSVTSNCSSYDGCSLTIASPRRVSALKSNSVSSSSEPNQITSCIFESPILNGNRLSSRSGIRTHGCQCLASAPE